MALEDPAAVQRAAPGPHSAVWRLLVLLCFALAALAIVFGRAW